VFKNWIAIALVVLVPGVLDCNKDSASLTAPTAPSLTPSQPPATSLLMKGTVSDTAYRPLAEPGLLCSMVRRPG